jgi:foldase protein PrsA
MDMAKLVLGEYKYSYEQLFDDQVWQKNFNDMTTEEYIKNKVKDNVENIILAHNLATSLNIELTNDERARIKMASDEYMETLKDSDVSVDAVREFYQRLLVAEKGFYGITDSVDTRVSTDEARVISVQYIFFSTMCYDEEHNVVSISEIEKQTKKNLANRVHNKLQEDVDFLALAKEYSDDVRNFTQFGRGEYVKEFEEAAFNMDSGDISDVIETEYGYYIIKCINYNIESNFEEQCEKVVLARRRDIYTGQYTEYASDRTVQYNSKFWEDVDMKELSKGSGKLYEIYNKYFY